MEQQIAEIQELIKQKSSFIDRLGTEISRVIVGQKYLIERLIIGLLSDGHILIEGVPGLAKTLSVKTLSDAIQTGFKRIQFTPDLLPGDLIGTQIYSAKDNKFTVRKGPIFSNLILADLFVPGLADLATIRSLVASSPCSNVRLKGKPSVSREMTVLS